MADFARRARRFAPDGDGRPARPDTIRLSDPTRARERSRPMLSRVVWSDPAPRGRIAVAAHRRRPQSTERNRSVETQPQHPAALRRPVLSQGPSVLLLQLATGSSKPVRVIFDAILRPATFQPRNRLRHPTPGLRSPARKHDHLVHCLFLDVVRRSALNVAALPAPTHHGRVNDYVAYVVATLLVLADVGSHSGP